MVLFFKINFFKMKFQNHEINSKYEEKIHKKHNHKMKILWMQFFCSIFFSKQVNHLSTQKAKMCKISKINMNTINYHCTITTKLPHHLVL